MGPMAEQITFNIDITSVFLFKGVVADTVIEIISRLISTTDFRGDLLIIVQ